MCFRSDAHTFTFVTALRREHTHARHTSPSAEIRFPAHGPPAASVPAASRPTVMTHVLIARTKRVCRTKLTLFTNHTWSKQIISDHQICMHGDTDAVDIGPRGLASVPML